MNMASISGQAALSQMMAASQAGAASAISSDTSEEDDAFETAVSGTSPGAAGTGLAGSTTGTLDNQTLLALLGLTQTDPSDGSPSQIQGTKAPHHHRHHGGGMSPPTDPSNTTDASNSATATGQPDNDDASDNLTAATG
jgi:hypothetical protein